MEKVKMALVAKSIGVSLNSVYRKVKQCETELNGHISKEKGITFVSAEGVEVLRSLFQKLNPSETTDGKDFATVKHLEKVIADQQRTIDSLISQHADERARSAEERHRSDTIILKRTQDVGSLQKSLEYRQPEPTKHQEEKSQVIPEVQKVRVDPRELPREVIVSQREISTWESVQITFNDVMGFLFGIDPGRKAA